MTITAANVINAALRELTVLGNGETPTTEETADGLLKLEQIIDSWNAEELSVPFGNVAVPLTGATSYAIGSGATVDVARPVKVAAASLTMANGVTVPVDVVGAVEWSQVMDRSATSLFVRKAYYRASYPNGTIFVYPVAATGTLNLEVLVALTVPSASSDSINLPSGYIHALVMTLAVALAPMFGKAVTPELAASAAQAKQTLQALNAAIQQGRPETPAMPQQQAA